MQSLTNSYELLVFLKEQNLLENSPKFWWPSSDDFEILVGAILTQNTKWINVEKSLQNLKKLELLSLETLANADINLLINAIAPSGFKNQKASRLKLLCKNIIKTFETFETFQKSVTSSWLLKQKGIGLETKDAILCYCCHQEYMVVDKYTAKLLLRFGYEFDTYEDIQTWLVYGINENYDKIVKLYGYEISLNEIYCKFHGKIVEFMKRNPKD
ncbi:3-methyladenine DNA glycosylase [Malaciobacter mytili]|uniref:3-methyladenine DNA glycosylase n=1 Tax=Malaciobacter mytili LMG 24559 TaxID=1032238 RepID=A0AAX2AKV0_9BACT|nr:3-methyladenine DNA glycosylase [Malaciobacter mytili]AXH14140.1 3-methyladenine DNA glycosylase [Malaciobacter mytili LMG 24559]RXI36995.1 3-methyladenine DNA glycosylase [Malaciobacter mytili]RXK17016.1 3-methyladenine DNA glycosylase [Malaciobacter mytili LMG 24559]